MQARKLLVSAISDETIECLYKGCDTAYQMLRTLDREYMRESTALQIICRRNLEEIRLKDDEKDLSKFFSDFDKAVNDLINS